MKIRSGFVSNSSSSSFLIWGVYSPELPDDVMELARKEHIKEAWAIWYQEKLQTDYAKKYPEDYPTDSTFEEWLEKHSEGYNDKEEFVFGKILEIVGLEHYDPFWDGEHYFGVCPTKMSDDETMGEFKKRIEGELEKLFDNVQCGWQEYAWRDG